MGKLQGLLDTLQERLGKKTKSGLDLTAFVSTRYHMNSIRTLLSSGLTRKELRYLCKDVSEFRPVYEKLGSRAGKAQTVQLLLDYVGRNLQVEILLAWVKEHFPAKYRKYQPYRDSVTSPAVPENIIPGRRERDAKETRKECKTIEEIKTAEVDTEPAGSARSDRLRQQAQEKRRKRHIRRQIQDEFFLLPAKEEGGIDQIAEFLWKFNEEMELVQEALSPYKYSESYPAVIVWRYLAGKTGGLDKQILKQKLLAERKTNIEAKLPDPIVVPVKTNEYGPRIEAVTLGKIQLLLEHLLRGSSQGVQVRGDFPVDQVGDYTIHLEFSDGIKFPWTTRLELQQDELPADCLEYLQDISPINLSKTKDVLEQMQSYLAEVSPTDVLECYPRMSAVLVTAYRTGYWKSAWVQKVLGEWRAEHRDYLSSLKMHQMTEVRDASLPPGKLQTIDRTKSQEELTKELADTAKSETFSQPPDISTDKILGLSHPSEVAVLSDAVRGMQSSARLVKQDLMRCKAKEIFLGNIPGTLKTLIADAEEHSLRPDNERCDRFLKLARVYAERRQESLMKYSLALYSFLKGKLLWSKNRRRDARPYLRVFLFLYGQLSAVSTETQRDIKSEFYNALTLYLGTYNVNILYTEDDFYSGLLRLLVTMDKKQFETLGRCIVEISVANSWFTSDLINRLKMRKDTKKALQSLTNSLQSRRVFQLAPLQCLQLLGRINISTIPVALSRQNIARGSSADVRRLVAINLVRFANSSTHSPNVILRGLAQQATIDWKTNMAFSLLVEPFLLNSPRSESELKAKLMTGVLGFPSGARTTEYFLGKITELAVLFDKFYLSTDSNVKGKYGYSILETIRITRKWLAEQLRGELKETMLQFFRSVDTYVTAEQSKLIRDTTLELTLVSDRAVYSPIQTRITIEIRNVGEGIADSLELKVLPVRGQYRVEDRYGVYYPADISDKTPVQIEIFVQPIVVSNTSLEMSVILQYNTLKRNGKKAKLTEDNCTVRLYPETEFTRIVQSYRIDAPATTWFYGRQDILQSMADNLQMASGHGAPMIIYGLRRAGKTSVVKRLIEQTLSERGLNENYIPVYADLVKATKVKDIRTDGDFLYFLIEIIAQSLSNQEPSIYFPFTPSEIKGDFQDNPFESFSFLLGEIFQLIQPRQMLLVLDEFSALYDCLRGAKSGESLTPQMFGFLSNMIQDTHQLTFIFTGTYVLLEMMREYAFDLAKICTPRLISFLDDTSARRLIVEPVAQDDNSPGKGWLEYDPRVVDRIVTVTNRHPYLIQYLCMLLVDRMNILKYNNVNLNDVNSIITDVISKPAHEMSMLTLWKEFSTPQHKVLSVIAAQSSSARSWVDIDEIVKTFAQFRDSMFIEDILKVCSSLVDAELLEKSTSEETDSYTITIPLYQMWLKQNKPTITVFSE